MINRDKKRNLAEELSSEEGSSELLQEAYRSLEFHEPSNENLISLSLTRRFVVDEFEEVDSNTHVKYDIKNRRDMMELVKLENKLRNSRMVGLNKEFEYDFEYNKQYTSVRLFISQVDALEDFGVFAEEPIPPHTFLGCYAGERIRMRKDNGQHLLEIKGNGDKEFIEAERRGDWTFFINHSVTPNVIFKEEIIKGQKNINFYSLAPIQPGEQLLVNYSPRNLASIRLVFHPPYLNSKDNSSSPYEICLRNSKDYFHKHENDITKKVGEIYIINEKFQNDLIKIIYFKAKYWLLPKIISAIIEDDIRKLNHLITKKYSVNSFAYACDEERNALCTFQQHLTPLMIACYLGRLRCAEILIENGADIDRFTLLSGQTAAMLLLLGDANDLMVSRLGNFFLNNMRYPFIRDVEGRNLLNYAILKKSYDMIFEIIKLANAKKFDIFDTMIPRKSGIDWGNLDYCVIQGEFQILQLLMEELFKNPALMGGDFLKNIQNKLIFTGKTLSSTSLENLITFYTLLATAFHGQFASTQLLTRIEKAIETKSALHGKRLPQLFSSMISLPKENIKPQPQKRMIEKTEPSVTISAAPATLFKRKKVDPHTGEYSNADDAIPYTTYKGRRKVDPDTGKPSQLENAISYSAYLRHKKKMNESSKFEKEGMPAQDITDEITDSLESITVKSEPVPITSPTYRIARINGKTHIKIEDEAEPMGSVDSNQLSPCATDVILDLSCYEEVGELSDLDFAEMHLEMPVYDVHQPEDLKRLEEADGLQQYLTQSVISPPPLQIKHLYVIPAAKGVFASGPITELEFPLGDYLGERAEHEDSAYIFSTEEGSIDALHKRNWTAYMNHSYNPNVRIEELEGGVVRFYPNRAISPGEQLTINYGVDYFKNLKFNPSYLHKSHDEKSDTSKLLNYKQAYIPKIIDWDNNAAAELFSKCRVHSQEPIYYVIPKIFQAILSNDLHYTQILLENFPADLCAYAVIKTDEGFQLLTPSEQEYITPLMLAAYCGRIEIVQLLVEKGADLNRQMFNKGESPLSIIVNACYDKTTLADYLINVRPEKIEILEYLLVSKTKIINLLMQAPVKAQTLDHLTHLLRPNAPTNQTHVRRALKNALDTISLRAFKAASYEVITLIWSIINEDYDPKAIISKGFRKTYKALNKIYNERRRGNLHASLSFFAPPNEMIEEVPARVKKHNK